VAEPHDLPIHADVAQEGSVGDVVVGDVVDLKAAGQRIAQQHVGGVGAEEAAQRDEGPVGSDLAQGIPCEDRVVADVVDLVLARHGGGGVRAAQDHVGGGAGWRRRIRHGDFKVAVGAGGVAVIPDDLRRGVDAVGKGAIGGQRIVEGNVAAAAVKEAVAL